MIKRTDIPLPHFRANVPWLGERFPLLTDHIVTGRPVAFSSPAETFYLYDEGGTWWACVRDTIELNDYEESRSAGEVPEYTTLPTICLPGYENSFDWLLEHFVHPDVPWEQFGMERVEDGWRSLVIDHPEVSFDEWVRKGIRNNYKPHLFGKKSKEVQYRILRTVSEASTVIHHLLPRFLQRWEDYYSDRSRDVELEQQFAAQLPPAQLHRMVEALELTTYLGSHLFPGMAQGLSVVIGAFHRGEPIGVITGTLMPAPKCYKVSGEYVLNAELIMMDGREEFRRFSLGPVLHIHLMKYAFWRLGECAVSLGANFDTEIDGYKQQFQPREVQTPGLRWLEKRTLRDALNRDLPF